MIIVGGIFFGIMLLRLPEEPNVNQGFKITGILYIIGLVLLILPIASIVGLILLIVSLILIYVFSGSSIKSLMSKS